MTSLHKRVAARYLLSTSSGVLVVWEHLQRPSNRYGPINPKYGWDQWPFESTGKSADDTLKAIVNEVSGRFASMGGKWQGYRPEKINIEKDIAWARSIGELSGLSAKHEGKFLVTKALVLMKAYRDDRLELVINIYSGPVVFFKDRLTGSMNNIDQLVDGLFNLIPPGLLYTNQEMVREREIQKEIARAEEESKKSGYLEAMNRKLEVAGLPLLKKMEHDSPHGGSISQYTFIDDVPNGLKKKIEELLRIPANAGLVRSSISRWDGDRMYTTGVYYDTND